MLSEEKGARPPDLNSGKPTSGKAASRVDSGLCPSCGAALRPDARFCAACGAPAEHLASDSPEERAEKDNASAATFALLFGGLGAHKFYLGYKTEGLIMLALTVYGVVVNLLWGVVLVNVAVVGVALVEAVIYGTMPDAQFEETYIEGKRPWF